MSPRREQPPVPEECDALVVGGAVAGLTVAYLLAQYGYKTVLVEKGPALGGVDRSFQNKLGRRFDFGMHALDYNRAPFATKLFESALDGRCHRLPKKRGIVLAGEIIPYNVPAGEWPDSLRELFPAGPLYDELGSAAPTRENLARFYGKPFVDLIFDDALASYPAETHHLAFGVDEAALMVNVYPWFFPRAERARPETNTSRRYQDDVREHCREEVLYPDEGGFGAFPAGLERKLVEAGATVLTAADDLEFEMDPATDSVRSVRVHGRSLRPERVYWCAGPKPLCPLLDKPLPDTNPDRFVLGSFQFERPLTCDYLELILGDSQQLINRLSFPGKLALEADDLVQLEFAFPRDSKDFGVEPGFWHESWLTSLRQLGIAQADNEVLDFDFKTFPILYNSFGIEGKPMPEVDFTDLSPDSNLRPVEPTIRKVNINTRVPMYLRYLAEDLSRR